MYFLSKWIEHVYIIYVCSIITHIINVFSVKMNNTCLYNLYYLIEENEKQDIPHRGTVPRWNWKTVEAKYQLQETIQTKSQFVQTKQYQWNTTLGPQKSKLIPNASKCPTWHPRPALRQLGPTVELSTLGYSRTHKTHGRFCRE